MSKCLYIHIRDFRYTDNATYNKVLEKCKPDNIIKVFFYNKEQINNKKYSSNTSVKFFTEKVKELRITGISVRDLNDIIYKINELYKKNNFKYIAYHYDYTIYAIKRQKMIEEYCKKNNIILINTHDQLLLKDFHLKQNKETYYKFTPYYNTYPINKVKSLKMENKVLENYNYNYKDYSSDRNDLSKNTSRLSIYLKYGVISPREAYNYFKSNKEMTKQLIWRDFYYTYYYFHQESYNGDTSFYYEWKHNPIFLNKWKNGMTGFPIIDAAMRQLKQENYMHNRTRMIVANFLCKILFIDWKYGEQHFSKNLRDIDLIQNMAGWHSVVSIAKHSLPYFRVFNPWIQSKKYDSKCIYIKKYIPELKDTPNEDIHKWDTSYKKYTNITKYPRPIVDYQIRKDTFFKSIIKKK